VGPVYRDAEASRDLHSLDCPFPRLVLGVVDAVEGVDRDALWSWLHDEHLPRMLRGSTAAMCLAFRPMPLPTDRQSFVHDLPGLDRRLTLLWFTDGAPADAWETTFAGFGSAVAASGSGRVELMAPFVPTVPGTERYVDELR